MYLPFLCSVSVTVWDTEKFQSQRAARNRGPPPLDLSLISFAAIQPRKEKRRAVIDQGTDPYFHSPWAKCGIAFAFA